METLQGKAGKAKLKDWYLTAALAMGALFFLFNSESFIPILNMLAPFEIKLKLDTIWRVVGLLFFVPPVLGWLLHRLCETIKGD